MSVEKTFATENTASKETSDDNRGGHNKENIMLNINTFKNFCLKSGTKKADDIHDYFIKLEDLLQEIFKEEIIKEENNELKQQFLTYKDTKNKETEEKLIKQKELDNEKFLLNEYTSVGNMIYIIKVKTNEDGTYVVKIGESRKGITEIYNDCKLKHKQILLLNCYKVDKSKDFESFLHNHTIIYPYKYKKIEGHEKENELFLIGKELTYQILLKIVDDNINNYNYRVSELLENQLLKEKFNTTQTNINNNDILELKQMVKQLLNKVYSLEQSNQEILNKLVSLISNRKPEYR